MRTPPSPRMKVFNTHRVAVLEGQLKKGVSVLHERLLQRQRPSLGHGSRRQAESGYGAAHVIGLHQVCRRSGEKRAVEYSVKISERRQEKVQVLGGQRHLRPLRLALLVECGTDSKRLLPRFLQRVHPLAMVLGGEWCQLPYSFVGHELNRGQVTALDPHVPRCPGPHLNHSLHVDET